MKNIKTLPVGNPAGASRQCQAKPIASKLPVIRAGIAIFVIWAQCLILSSDAQTLVTPGQGSQAAQTGASSVSLLAEHGRQHPSYQVFAGNLALPAIKVVNKTTLDVDGKLQMDVSRLDQLTIQQKETLAARFQVPVGVVDTFQASFSGPAPTDAAQAAGKLRVIVIDYKYLLEKWTQYLPPTGKEKVKTDALLALRSGNVDEAWGMFLGLPRPEPPAGFRIAGQN